MVFFQLTFTICLVANQKKSFCPIACYLFASFCLQIRSRDLRFMTLVFGIRRLIRSVIFQKKMTKLPISRFIISLMSMICLSLPIHTRLDQSWKPSLRAIHYVYLKLKVVTPSYLYYKSTVTIEVTSRVIENIREIFILLHHPVIQLKDYQMKSMLPTSIARNRKLSSLHIR